MMKKMFTTIILACLIMPTICLGGSSVNSYVVNKGVQVVPVISAAAYAVGDQLGAKFKIPGLVDNDNKAGILTSVINVDLDSQNASLQVWYFSQEPATVAGDNNVFDISDADMAYSLGASTAGATYATSASNSVTASDVIFRGLRSTARDTTNKATGDIWAVIKIIGAVAPTYTTTSSVKLTFFVQ